MSGDLEAARRLMKEKVELRSLELTTADRHFERLREGRPESIETSSLHLDVVRDLRRIHSHLRIVAYAVLEAAGQVRIRSAVTKTGFDNAGHAGQTTVISATLCNA